ncbi:hypothetical protein HanPI659440_Chr13g0495721 [Helianthus annuus]|nr:hypothetical protein HanPI659440_Chr13g0495721 [Helianthus annuus]
MKDSVVYKLKPLPAFLSHSIHIKQKHPTLHSYYSHSLSVILTTNPQKKFGAHTQRNQNLYIFLSSFSITTCNLSKIGLHLLKQITRQPTGRSRPPRMVVRRSRSAAAPLRVAVAVVLLQWRSDVPPPSAMIDRWSHRPAGRFTFSGGSCLYPAWFRSRDRETEEGER